MMGTKQRNFVPLINVSVEDLVPVDLFYRHLEQSLVLSFVAARAHLDAATFEAGWAAGQAMTEEQAITEALQDV